MSDLQSFAARIAKTTAWIQDGVACLDPLTGKRWRWFEDHWEGKRDYRNPFADQESQQRGEASGPDWGDTATIGILLGPYGYIRHSQNDDGETFVFCNIPDKTCTPSGSYPQTRALAVLEAYCKANKL